MDADIVINLFGFVYSVFCLGGCVCVLYFHCWISPGALLIGRGLCLCLDDFHVLSCEMMLG